VHVFLFDRDLVCRYAAPAGDTFLGRPPARLVGRHADDVLLPVRGGLGPILEQALAYRISWQHDHVPLVTQDEDAGEPACWQVQVDPVEVNGDIAVLVSLLELDDTGDDREELRAEVEQLRRRDEEQRRMLLDLYTDLRTLLTPVSGYLQVIARRPYVLGGRSVGEVIGERVLPTVQRITARLDRMIQSPAARPAHDTAAPVACSRGYSRR
jgi:signal transduction histidine kinase